MIAHGRGPTNDCTWHELARCDVPLAGRDLWRALLDKTEYPEHYSQKVSHAELIDHDAQTVVRRTFANGGEDYIEWVCHEVQRHRVECRRGGQAFRRAQALVQTPQGAMLVYEVDDPRAARAEGGIDATYAAEVLSRIVSRAHSLLLPAT